MAPFDEPAIRAHLEAHGVQAGATAGPASDGPQRLQAPMPGKIIKVRVKAGDPVEAGTPLVVIEAMKMENELRATQPGRIESVSVTEGQAVEASQELLVLLPSR